MKLFKLMIISLIFTGTSLVQIQAQAQVKDRKVMSDIFKVCRKGTKKEMGLEKGKEFCSCVVKNHDAILSDSEAVELLKYYSKKKDIKNKQSLMMLDDAVIEGCLGSSDWQSKQLKELRAKKKKAKEKTKDKK